MTSRRSSSRKGNRAVKLDVIGTIPLACLGDAFRWDRKGIRTLAKYSKYLEVEGLWDWPKTAERELRAGLIVGAQSPQDAYEGPWSVELLKKFGISGTDEGLFYDFKQLGLALVNDAGDSSEPHPEKVAAMEVFGHLGIWGLDVPTTYDAGVPSWVRKQWVPARDAGGSRLDRVEVRSKGWWSGVHVNEGGCVVGIEQSYGRQILFYSEMNVPNVQAVKWLKKSLHQYKYANTGPWRHTVLEPGTFIIMPPAKPHAIYSLEKSVASVQLWYQVDALPLTEVSNQLDAPPAPHQSKPDAQPALTAIAQAALDDGYENIGTAPLQALCRLLHAPSTADSDEDFGDVVVLEDSEADDVDEPDYSHDPDSSGITREPLDKVELLKRLESDMKDRPQAPQHSPTRNNFRSNLAQAQIHEPHINSVHVKLQSKSLADASPLILSYPADDPHPVQIRQRDYETLRLGVTAPLPSALVEFGIKYWIHQLASTNPALAAQIYLFSPLFYARLSSPDLGYPSVEKWGDAADMAASAFIIVPICMNDHWYLAIIHQPHALAPADVDSDASDSQTPASPIDDAPTTVYTLDALGLPHLGTIALLRKYLALKYRTLGNPSSPKTKRRSELNGKYWNIGDVEVVEDWSHRTGGRVQRKSVEVARGGRDDSAVWMLWNLRAVELLETADPTLLAELKSEGARPKEAPDVQRARLATLIRRLVRGLGEQEKEEEDIEFDGYFKERKEEGEAV